MSELLDFRKKLKHELKPVRSKKFLTWFEKKYPNYEAHHLLGSFTSMKHTDYLLMPVTREQHETAEKYKSSYCYTNIARSLNILFEYIQELENK